jgi:hypothetical protein
MPYPCEKTGLRLGNHNVIRKLGVLLDQAHSAMLNAAPSTQLQRSPTEDLGVLDIYQLARDKKCLRDKILAAVDDSARRLQRRRHEENRCAINRPLEYRVGFDFLHWAKIAEPAVQPAFARHPFIYRDRWPDALGGKNNHA